MARQARVPWTTGQEREVEAIRLHWFGGDNDDECQECGYWAQLDSVRRRHVEDTLNEQVALIKAEALREAADELDAQPPKTKSCYVATLRLYADEPQRMQVRADRVGGES